MTAPWLPRATDYGATSSSLSFCPCPFPSSSKFTCPNISFPPGPCFWLLWQQLANLGLMCASCLLSSEGDFWRQSFPVSEMTVMGESQTKTYDRHSETGSLLHLSNYKKKAVVHRPTLPAQATGTLLPLFFPFAEDLCPICSDDSDMLAVVCPMEHCPVL